MAWLETFRLAEIHDEVYAAILKGWIADGQRGVLQQPGLDGRKIGDNFHTGSRNKNLHF